MTETLARECLVELRQILSMRFSISELKTLCFDLGVDYENLPGETKEDKARELVSHLDRRQHVPKLVKIGKRLRPDIAWEQVLGEVNLTSEAIKGEYSKLQSDTEQYTAPQEPDVEFRDREASVFRIINNKANHIELFGPSGVGKTYLLRHIADGHKDVRTVYIDLADCYNIDDILLEAFKQLGGQLSPMPRADFMDLAIAIRDMQNQAVSQILFLFDSATEDHRELIDWLAGSEGLINNQALFDAFKMIGVRSEDITLKVVIAAQRPVVKTGDYHDYHANFHFDRIPIERLRKHLDPAQDPIQGMVMELAERSRIPVSPNSCQEISDQVYYLTGGHPKCAKLLLSEFARLRFSRTKWQKDWEPLFKKCVYRTIQSEMLGSVQDLSLLPIFWTLSIFRRFDQRMLGTLTMRGILPRISDGLDCSRDARKYRTGLVDTYLVNQPTQETGIYNTMNYMLRRVLSLGMQYNSPGQYRTLNRIALEIFTERLQSANQPSLRSILSLIDIVYHFLKILEMDTETKKDDICGQIQHILELHLSSLLEKIDEDERLNFLSYFKDIWYKDRELEEIAYRITGGSKCFKDLSRQIQQLVDDNS